MERISSQSKQYLHSVVSAQTPAGTTIDPSSDAVDLAVLATGTPPDGTTTWTAGTWTAGADSTHVAQLIVGPGSTFGTLDPGTYDVYVRITDSPEVPVLFSHTIEVY